MTAPVNYVDKFIYALLSKRESGEFPDDAEFTEAGNKSCISDAWCIKRICLSD